MDGLERVCLVTGRAVKRLVPPWGGSWTNSHGLRDGKKGMETKVVSGAHLSVSSGSSGPVISYDLLSGMTSQSVPGPCHPLGGKETGGFLAPTPSCGNPSPTGYFRGFGPPGPHAGLA